MARAGFEPSVWNRTESKAAQFCDQYRARLARDPDRRRPGHRSSPGAEDGRLTIIVGGDPDAFERARSVLGAMGKLIVYCGPLGQVRW
jgi:3-hydroxyisobutyrate dehydrogenase-like beta-hydroxyacid dehydrogenase